MPIRQAQIWQILQDKRSHFASFDQQTLALFQRYRTSLAAVSQESEAEILTALRSLEPFDRGAEPVEPLEDAPNWVKASGLAWQNREDSLAWVRDRLSNVSTFAVDGSQIYPSKDLSIPIALVQIGWFENLHRADARYEKDIAVDVMTPVDLQMTNSGDPVDRRVNLRRFQLETERLIQYMDDHSNTGNCLAFFDGSLVVTFAEAFDETTRNFYVECMSELLQASRQYRVPLVSYIDTTYARDLVVMLQRLEDLPDAPALHDAPLLNSLMAWGDRTPLFRCRRSGVLKHYPAALRDHILFTYLKAHDGFPVRLELPLWVYEAGQAEQVLDWVRGEIIIGGGYPYVIETADQTAVLKADDRQVFLKLLQDWAEQENLNLRLSRKMVSKVRRR